MSWGQAVITTVFKKNNKLYVFLSNTLDFHLCLGSSWMQTYSPPPAGPVCLCVHVSTRACAWGAYCINHVTVHAHHISVVLGFPSLQEVALSVLSGQELQKAAAVHLPCCTTFPTLRTIRKTWGHEDNPGAQKQKNTKWWEETANSEHCLLSQSDLLRQSDLLPQGLCFHFTLDHGQKLPPTQITLGQRFSTGDLQECLKPAIPD